MFQTLKTWTSNYIGWVSGLPSRWAQAFAVIGPAFVVILALSALGNAFGSDEKDEGTAVQATSTQPAAVAASPTNPPPTNTAAQPTSTAVPPSSTSVPPTATQPSAAPTNAPPAPPTATNPPPPPLPTATTKPAGNCSPAYPTVCIPPPPPDLNCKDVPYKDFRVLPPDPHHFDGNNDGVGCES